MALHIVSYSFPPDNVPAAHRPYQFVCHLSQAGIPFRLYSRHGAVGASDVPRSPTGTGGPRSARETPTRLKSLIPVIEWLQFLFEIDKALPWGLKTIPRLWIDLMASWLRTGQRPLVWATSPLVTNLYVATIAGILSFSRVHIDLRDAIPGISSARMPILTWIALRYASTTSVVTPSLKAFVLRRARYLNPHLIYNGVSQDALASARSRIDHGDGWIRVTYAGAIYGGQRPYEQAVAALRDAAVCLTFPYKGIELIFVGREDVSSLPERFGTERLRITARGEVTKQAALDLAASSDVNLVLVGGSEGHRCGIPLKVYDLLGVGRPILYFGPTDSDARLFLEEYARDSHHAVDAEGSIAGAIEGLAGWLMRNSGNETQPLAQPSASSQANQIVELIALDMSDRTAGR